MNDIHFPYECKTRYKVALKILLHIRPSHIYLNGDIGEFQGVSAWPVHPNDKNLNLFAELTYLNKKFDELQELFPDVPVTYIAGNHEHRMFRYIRDMAPQMWGVIPDCPELLKFDKRPGWKYVDYGVDQLVRCGSSKLWLRHEPLAGGQNHAAGTAVKSVVDLAYGHTHVYQAGSHRKFGPSPYTVRTYSLGFMGDRTRAIFDYRGSKDNWSEGITVVDEWEKTHDYQLHFVDMRRLPVMFDGQIFDAR